MADHYFKIAGEQITRKFALALLISVALHLAFIYGVKIRPVRHGVALHSVLEVRFGRVAAPRKKMLTQVPSAPDAKFVVDDIKPVTAKAPLVPPQVVADPVTEPRPLLAAGDDSKLPSLESPLAEDPTFYPAKQVDVHPVALQPVYPEYPQQASSDNVAGEVTLLLLIDEFGVVREVSVVEAKPEGYFEESAINAFRNTRFSPARKNGRDVKSRALIKVHYQMKDWKTRSPEAITVTK